MSTISNSLWQFEHVIFFRVGKFHFIQLRSLPSNENCAELFGIQEAESQRNGDRRLPLFEIARVLVRLDHAARLVVNTHHGIM